MKEKTIFGMTKRILKDSCFGGEYGRLIRVLCAHLIFGMLGGFFFAFLIL